MLTKKEIQREAKKSKRAAINCSVKKWKSIRDKVDKIKRDIYAGTCALCIRHGSNCVKCELYKKTGNRCTMTGTNWDRVNESFTFLENSIYDLIRDLESL